MSKIKVDSSQVKIRSGQVRIRLGPQGTSTFIRVPGTSCLNLEFHEFDKFDKFFGSQCGAVGEGGDAQPCWAPFSAGSSSD